MRALFLTWDGPQQSYLESLFLPIFAGLKAHDVEVGILQLTWGSDSQLQGVKRAADRLGIDYASRRFSARWRKLGLPALVAYGAVQAAEHATRCGVDVLFPRSLLPMAMALATVRLRPHLQLVFDADGFMADERVDFAGWRASSLKYRALRRVEASGVRHARAVICRTEVAREILIERAGPASAVLSRKIFVAPNAKDARIYSPGDAGTRQHVRLEQGIPLDAPWMVYAGSIGPQYCPRLMFATFGEVLKRRPDARFSCFTHHVAEFRELLSQSAVAPDAVNVRTANPAEIPGLLAAADLGFALRKESPSQRGVSPIKVSEYLLCGVPVASTRVGDLAAQLAGSDVALLVDSTDIDAPKQIAHWFTTAVLPDREPLRSSARELGLKWFELDECLRVYARALTYRENAE